MRKEKLSIAHLHWGFPPIIGGVETHLTIILPEMVRMGHNVSILTGAVEGVEGSYRYGGVNVLRSPLMDLNWLYKRGLKGLEDELVQLFASFLNEFKPNIVHVHNMNYFSEIHIYTLEKLVKKIGAPLILTAHNSWDDLLCLSLTHKVDWTHIIAVSHFIKKEIIGIGIDDSRITVIHHGIDEKKFSAGADTSKILRKYPQLKNKRIIFHPARIGLAKGCDISIKALGIIKEQYPDVMLVLAGSKNIIDWGDTQQKDIAYLVQLVKHFNLEENVLIDMYTLDEVREIYELCELCIYPSSAPEPFGLTMLEAMAMSKPIVVTNMGGMPEVVKDGINGFVIPVRDFELLAAKVCHLFEDKKLSRRFGYTGRQMVESQYTKSRVTKDTLSLYYRLL